MDAIFAESNVYSVYTIAVPKGETVFKSLGNFKYLRVISATISTLGTPIRFGDLTCSFNNSNPATIFRGLGIKFNAEVKDMYFTNTSANDIDVVISISQLIVDDDRTLIEQAYPVQVNLIPNDEMLPIQFTPLTLAAGTSVSIVNTIGADKCFIDVSNHEDSGGQELYISINSSGRYGIRLNPGDTYRASSSFYLFNPGSVSANYGYIKLVPSASIV